jgi:hypothetical protein
MPFAPRKAPQGTNPAVLLLEKTVVAPPGVESNNGVAMLVSFEEQADAQCHTFVGRPFLAAGRLRRHLEFLHFLTHD